jgi:hypothetical protein
MKDTNRDLGIDHKRKGFSYNAAERKGVEGLFFLKQSNGERGIPSEALRRFLFQRMEG